MATATLASRVNCLLAGRLRVESEEFRRQRPRGRSLCVREQESDLGGAWWENGTKARGLRPLLICLLPGSWICLSPHSPSPSIPAFIWNNLSFFHSAAPEPMWTGHIPTLHTVSGTGALESVSPTDCSRWLKIQKNLPSNSRKESHGELGCSGTKNHDIHYHKLKVFFSKDFDFCETCFEFSYILCRYNCVPLNH